MGGASGSLNTICLWSVSRSNWRFFWTFSLFSHLCETDMVMPGCCISEPKGLWVWVPAQWHGGFSGGFLVGDFLGILRAKVCVKFLTNFPVGRLEYCGMFCYRLDIVVVKLDKISFFIIECWFLPVHLGFLQTLDHPRRCPHWCGLRYRGCTWPWDRLGLCRSVNLRRIGP